jgi:hypothetical protein
MQPGVWKSFDAVVIGGALEANGMASFHDVVSREDAAAIKAYILDQAHLAWNEAHKSPAPAPGH